jgi:GNAT superfamily N-acetyltransferase
MATSLCDASGNQAHIEPVATATIDNHSMKIRKAEPADAESIAAHIKTQNTTEEIRDQIAYFQKQRKDDGVTEHLVAVENGQVAGNIVIIPTRYYPPGQSHRAELADIIIVPSHRGTGLLKQLVETAAESARSNGVSQLETSAWLSNPRAVAAYGKVGFTEWGRLSGLDRNGKEDTLVMLVKRI